MSTKTKGQFHEIIKKGLSQTINEQRRRIEIQQRLQDKLKKALEKQGARKMSPVAKEVDIITDALQKVMFD